MSSNIAISILSTLSKCKTTLCSLYAEGSPSSTSSPSNLAGRLVCTKRRKLLLLSWRAKDFISFHMNKEGAALCLSHTFKFLVAVRTEFFCQVIWPHLPKCILLYDLCDGRWETLLVFLR